MVRSDELRRGVAQTSSATSVAISFDGSERTRWLWAQGAVVLLVVLLALPSRRRVDDDEDEELGAEEVPA